MKRPTSGFERCGLVLALFRQGRSKPLVERPLLPQDINLSPGHGELHDTRGNPSLVWHVDVVSVAIHTMGFDLSGVGLIGKNGVELNEKTGSPRVSHSINPFGSAGETGFTPQLSIILYSTDKTLGGTK